MKINLKTIGGHEQIEFQEIGDPRHQVVQEVNEVGNGHVEEMKVSGRLEIVVNADQENDHAVPKHADDVDHDFGITHQNDSDGGQEVATMPTAIHRFAIVVSVVNRIIEIILVVTVVERL